MIRGKSAGAGPPLCEIDSDCKKARMMDRQRALPRVVLDARNTVEILAKPRKSR